MDVIGVGSGRLGSPVARMLSDALLSWGRRPGNLPSPIPPLELALAVLATLLTAALARYTWQVDRAPTRPAGTSRLSGTWPPGWSERVS